MNNPCSICHPEKYKDIESGSTVPICEECYAKKVGLECYGCLELAPEGTVEDELNDYYCEKCLERMAQDLSTEQIS